jgi:hypothetical protein
LACSTLSKCPDSTVEMTDASVMVAASSRNRPGRTAPGRGAAMADASPVLAVLTGRWGSRGRTNK